MKFSLQVLEGVHKGKSIPIPVAQFIIGRDPECHLRPSSPMISKRHCAIVKRGNSVFVQDFDSTNGTIVNDQRVKGEQELENHDVLKIGPLVFEVLLEKSVPIDRPTPIPGPKSQPVPEDDEAAAALLLDPADDSDSPKLFLETPKDADGVPSGSTVMEMPAMDFGEPKETSKSGVYRPPTPKPSTDANSSSAAEAILAKYSRRNRK